VFIQINYDEIKVQEYQLWRHFGDTSSKYVIKITSQFFSFLSLPLSKRCEKSRRWLASFYRATCCV